VGPYLARVGLVRHTDAEGITVDASVQLCDACASLDKLGWGSLSFQLNGATAVTAVAVTATKSCEAEATPPADDDAPTNSTAALLESNGMPYHLTVTATLPAMIAVTLGANANADVTISLNDAVLTLSHGDNSAFSSPLPAFDAVDWSAELSADVQVQLPKLGVQLRGTWTKFFVVSGGRPKLESGNKYVLGDPETSDGDKVEVTASLTYEGQGVTLTGTVRLVLPTSDSSDLFAGDGVLTLAAEKPADADSGAPVTGVLLQSLNVSITYNSDGQSLTIEGTGGVMELGTVVVTGVEASLTLSSGGGKPGDVATFSGTLEGKVAVENDADFVSLPGVPELQFNRISAAVELYALTSDDDVAATKIIFHGQVNHRVTGMHIGGKQTFFSLQGDLAFDFPCVGTASGDLISWGEIPSAVLMHDTGTCELRSPTGQSKVVPRSRSLPPRYISEATTTSRWKALRCRG